MVWWLEVRSGGWLYGVLFVWGEFSLCGVTTAATCGFLTSGNGLAAPPYTQTATAVAQANEYSGFNWMSSQKTTNKGKGGFNVMQAAIDAAEKA